MVLLVAQNEGNPGLGMPPRSKETHQLVAQTPMQGFPPANDFAQRDWGLAIGICVLVGIQLWQILKGQLLADNDLQKELVKAMLEERKVLLAAVLERKS